MLAYNINFSFQIYAPPCERRRSGSVPAPPVRLVRFSPDHFWICPIPFVLEYPNQPDTFHCRSSLTGPLQIWWRRPVVEIISTVPLQN